MAPSHSTSTSSSGNEAAQPPSEPPSQPASQPAPTSHPYPASSRPLPIRSSTFTSSDDLAGRRVSRKLQKKRPDGLHRPTMELPDRLKDRGDEAEREEDVRLHAYGGGFMTMNQSVFGLIAAAGSTVDFGNRFEGQSSDDEDDDEGSHRRRDGDGTSSGKTSQTTVLPRPPVSGTKGESKQHRRKISESRLLRSVPGLSRLTSRNKSKSSKGKARTDDRLSHEDDSPISPIPESPSYEPAVAPVMSRMLEARIAARPSMDVDRTDAESSEGGMSLLTQRLMAIFEFDKPEDVIEGMAIKCGMLDPALADKYEEYPCWLLQHVLLQGYMYITTRHVAFYAYLPKKSVSCLGVCFTSRSGANKKR